MEGINLTGLFAFFGAIFATFFLFATLLTIGVYVYTALAYMKIAKKTNTEPAWLAWIPVANLYLISKIAQMHWWPILLVIGFVIPIVNIFAVIAFLVFFIIWHWKLFEKVGRPGWWILLNFIPVVGQFIFLILLGMAAWGKEINV